MTKHDSKPGHQKGADVTVKKDQGSKLTDANKPGKQGDGATIDDDTKVVKSDGPIIDGGLEKNAKKTDLDLDKK